MLSVAFSGVHAATVTENAGEASSVTTTGPSSTASGTDKDSNDMTGACDKNKYVGDGPFCNPKNGTSWYVGGKYYVSWDDGIWAPNSSVSITLNYENPGKSGKIAQNWDLSNSLGFTVVPPESAWMMNQTEIDAGWDSEKVENQTLSFTITSNDPTKPGSRNIHPGPTIYLTSKPATPIIDKTNRPPVSVMGLAIGLPVVFAFILLMICGTHFCMRTRRQVGPISIGGGRRHFKKTGYSGRQARRQKAALGGETEYRDDAENFSDGRTPSDNRSREWELANVRGGR
ncbi:hypothetical protein EDC01DRAFT_621747 [Geopyxis carbonaria]|nr:hypothetical protein EDC01DRAFT_621747 [Geopyxis carbonaria]